MSEAIVSLVLPIANLISHLSVDYRITLLCALITQEMCTLPPGERADELDRVLHELPRILGATERGMREALVQNARA